MKFVIDSASLRLCVKKSVTQRRVVLLRDRCDTRITQTDLDKIDGLLRESWRASQVAVNNGRIMM